MIEWILVTHNHKSISLLLFLFMNRLRPRPHPSYGPGSPPHGALSSCNLHSPSASRTAGAKTQQLPHARVYSLAHPKDTPLIKPEPGACVQRTVKSTYSPQGTEFQITVNKGPPTQVLKGNVPRAAVRPLAQAQFSLWFSANGFSWVFISALDCWTRPPLSV